MTHFPMTRSQTLLGTFTLLALLGLPEASVAAGIGFRNETNGPIQVQGATFVNGMIRRSPPVVIPSAQIGWDANLSQGPRQITIYDAQRPNRILFHGIVLFQGNDMFYLVRPNLQPSPANPHPLILIPQQKIPMQPPQ